MKTNKILFVGPQGSGKGTQAKIIADTLNIPHISTGDLFRALQGDLKAQVDAIVKSGGLVPDKITIEILKERISKPDCESGFILDGFPRNLNQAKALDSIITIDKVIEISISDDEAIKRIGTRLSCKSCGSVFNLITNPPKKENICDKCGSQLYQRADDTEEALRKRLDIYHKETEPILSFYKSKKINGEQHISQVTKDILAELQS